jgi:hypothetical protein
MKGNFHVRFLEGGGLATARLHSAKRPGIMRQVRCLSPSKSKKYAKSPQIGPDGKFRA